MSELTHDNILDPEQYDTKKAILGTNIVLFVERDGALKPIANATANSLELNRETIELANKSLGYWASVMSGRKSWSTSVSGFVFSEDGINLDDLWNLFNNNDPIEVRFAPVGYVGESTAVDYPALPYFVGMATVTSLPITANDQEGMSFDISLTGVGALKMVTPDPTPAEVTGTKNTGTKNTGKKGGAK